MATTTANYNLIKPTMAESADIRTINGNMDTIDDIMHASQVSLADAYDSNETYNKDDVVMYQYLMYKCKEDNVTGSWNATKWERTTAGENGAGGTEVEANPSGTPSADLAKLGINGIIYSIPSGDEVEANPSGTGDTDLTKLGINGTVYNIPSGGGGDANYIELTQEEYDALSTSEKMNGTMYFITDGQNEGGDAFFFPIIYSKEEREVGTWIDGKPLYCKTWDQGSNVSFNSNTWKDTSIPNSDIEGIVNVYGSNYNNNKRSCFNGLSANADTGQYVQVLQNRNASITLRYITLYYTKITDTAGSGKYNTLGVPNVHYSEDEHIIGTWIDGSTLYEKTWQSTIPAWDSSKYGCVIGTGFTDYDEIVDIRGSLKGTAKAYGTLNGLEENGWRGNVHVTLAGEVMLYANNPNDVASLVGGKAIITIQYTKGGA